MTDPNDIVSRARVRARSLDLDERPGSAAVLYECATAIERLRVENERLHSKIGSLFAAIEHGDSEHRAWLKGKLQEHFA